MIEKLGIPNRPYCLFVSTIRPKKNVGTLIEAFDDPVLKDINLICAGRIDYPAYVEEVKEKGIKNVFFPGYLESQMITDLYHHAEAFLFISQTEGFGLPILEA